MLSDRTRIMTPLTGNGLKMLQIRNNIEFGAAPPALVRQAPFKPNPLVKKPGPRSSSNGEDGTASHEAKPDAFLSSNFW